MAISWNSVKQTLTTPWKAMGAKPAPAPEAPEAPADGDQRYRMIESEIASLHREVGSLKTGIATEARQSSEGFSFDLRRALIRARDLRYKIYLLEAERGRSAWSEDDDGMAAEDHGVPETPRELEHVAEQILVNGEFGGRGTKSAYKRAIRDLTGDSPGKRKAAVTALGKLDSPESVLLLKAALAYDDDLLRVECLRALSDLSEAGVNERLEDYLAFPHYEARLSALRGLYNLGSEESVTACLECLADLHPEVRRAAAVFLGQLEARGTDTALTVLLRDEDTEVRLAAAKALGSLSSEQAVYMLIRALADDEKVVREEARGALERALGAPLEVDLDGGRQDLDSQVEALLRWWAEVRPKGRPWRIPDSAGGDQSPSGGGRGTSKGDLKNVGTPECEKSA